MTKKMIPLFLSLVVCAATVLSFGLSMLVRPTNVSAAIGPPQEEISMNWKGTLVTRLTYSDATKDAVPINGGSFNNGHTFVEISIAEASTEAGLWFTIADSSKNNGKKTPDQYNRPIEYAYQVKISDGFLTVSFDSNLTYANVGATVFTEYPTVFTNAPKHYKNSVTIALPSDALDTIYLYTHIDGLAATIFK